MRVSTRGVPRRLFSPTIPGWGALPLRLTELRRLEGLLAGGTDLCAPSDADFQTWRDTVLRVEYKRLQEFLGESLRDWPGATRALNPA